MFLVGKNNHLANSLNFRLYIVIHIRMIDNRRNYRDTHCAPVAIANNQDNDGRAMRAPTFFANISY
jgi:hypothetical protein